MMDGIAYFEVSVWKNRGKFYVMSRYAPNDPWSLDTFERDAYETQEEAYAAAQHIYEEVKRELVDEPAFMVKKWAPIERHPIKPYKPPPGYEMVRNPVDGQEFLVFKGDKEQIASQKSYPYGEYPNHSPMHYEGDKVVKKPRILDPDVQNITPQST